MKKEQFNMVAKTFQGLEEVLAEEIIRLGGTDVEIGRRMVAFVGDKELLYRANLGCRTALRILKPFLTFQASNTDELYEAVKGFEWEKMLSLDKTFSVDSVVFSDDFKHSKFITYRAKDAIADYFMEKYGKRPSVRVTNADVMFNLHIANHACSLSLDSSGESLHKRGYRVAQTEAPMNEVLAAGILLKTGWKGECNLIDPMCGSGTLLIEAAMIATNTPPGIYRKEFAFERWNDFDEELFDKVYNDASQDNTFEHRIIGADISPRAIEIARENIRSAGFSKQIDLQVRPLQQWEQPLETGIIVTNPPYGERISSKDLVSLYQTIGERLKHAFRGYKAWIISYREECFEAIGLKPTVKLPLMNGALECELRQYEVFDGKYKDFKSEGGALDKIDSPRPSRSSSSRDSRPPYDKGDRKPYDRDSRPPYDKGDRKPYDRDSRPPYDKGDRKPYDRDSRPPFDKGDRKPYDRDSRPPFDKGDRKPYDRDSRPPFDKGDRKPYDRDSRPPFDREVKRGFGEFADPRATREPFAEPRAKPEMIHGDDAIRRYVSGRRPSMDSAKQPLWKINQENNAGDENRRERFVRPLQPGENTIVTRFKKNKPADESPRESSEE